MKWPFKLSINVTLMVMLLVLACGPANESVQQELGKMPQDQPAVQPPIKPVTTSRVSQQTPETPTETESNFKDRCHITGFNMFEHPTTDLEDNIWCYNRQLDEYTTWLATLPNTPALERVQQAWLEVLQVVKREPEVSKAHTKVISCLGEKGFDNVNADLLFPWQDVISASAYETRMRGYTASEREQQIDMYVPSDQCAMGDSAYYYAQSLAWRAEIKRLQADDPNKVKPLVDAYLVHTLDRLGPNIYEHAIPHYLTLYGGEIFRDGAGTNPNPLPTPFPTQPAGQRESNVPESVPPPGGLEGCQAYNQFSSRMELSHIQWCADQVLNKLVACRDTGDAAQQLACGKNHISDWQEYSIRMWYHCFALNELAGRNSCLEDADLAGKFRTLRQSYGETLTAVANDEAVRSAHTKVIKCLTDQSFEGVEDRLLFHWQKLYQYYSDGDALLRWADSFTQAEQALIQRLEAPSDACATEQGLYAAQDAAWLAEVKRLKEADPAKAQPFVDWGILQILEEDGVAPFLTLQ